MLPARWEGQGRLGSELAITRRQHCVRINASSVLAATGPHRRSHGIFDTLHLSSNNSGDAKATMHPSRSGEVPAGEFDDADREALERKLQESLETLSQIRVTMMNHEAADEHVLQQRVDRLVRGYADMHLIKDRLTVNVPEEVLTYVKDGRNPDEFTSQFMERVASENQFTNGKIAALTNFKQEYEAKIREYFPDDADNRLGQQQQ
ncbi:RNA polymerase II mediator complex subunit [Coemansia sp. RSA 2322]|nr:RNA polymerase II mediator complex subunit [Coemansia sp. RSA 2322]KAJ2472734.1 RNA polymerase II mediator complex subunit [Coemansia sp. RSA 2320]